MWLNPSRHKTESEMGAVLSALSDPTRRAILSRLAGGEARVTDLAKPFPMSLNAISKHIRVLERATLVRRRRAGSEHLLSLNPEPVDRAIAWMESERARWAARLQKLDDILRAEDAADQPLGAADAMVDVQTPISQER